ncbi:MAG: MFS transporter [Clostridiaceae bacterium]|nr:MFS transporter [Clostridiaceae bacterium]
MYNRLKELKIVRSFNLLKGNTRTSVLCEPLWGIPYTIYIFYFSLYLMEMGITEQQLGIITAVGFLSNAVFSFFAGSITDFLGRKKTTFIFDLIGWPVSLFLYLISRSMTVFIIATIINNLTKVVAVSWNMMVIEDADSDQRKSAFNLLNIINISLGILTPIAGLVVAKYGVIKGERYFMIFAMLSMTAMVLIRNKGYVETKVGQQILNAQKGVPYKEILKKGMYKDTIKQIFSNKLLMLAMAIQILFNLTIPLGAYNSMYFIPYMTGYLGIDKAASSVLGGVYAGVMLFVFLFITPNTKRKNIHASILTGLFLQTVAFLLITMLPEGILLFAVLAVGIYSFGYGIFIPFFNTLLADISEGRERAGIYSLLNTIVAIFSAIIGSVSGYIYAADPRFIFYLTAFITSLCFIGMVSFIVYDKKHKRVIKA